MIELKKGRRYAAMWVVGDGKTRDWLAAVYRDEPDGTWQLVYRFRYYADDKLGEESRDARSWYSVESKDTDSAKIIEATRGMWNALRAFGFGSAAKEIALDTDDPEVIGEKMMSEAPEFFHLRRETVH